MINTQTNTTTLRRTQMKLMIVLEVTGLMSHQRQQ